EFELACQELTEPLANLLRLLSGPYETEKEVIGVPNVAQPSVVRVTWVPYHQLTTFAFQTLDRVEVLSSLRGLDLCGEARVLRVVRPAFALRVRRDQRALGEPVQFVQVDVGQQRADDTPLRRAAEGVMVAPVLHVPRLEQALDQPH